MSVYNLVYRSTGMSLQGQLLVPVGVQHVNNC
ncbi:hypothetical protein Golax_023219 [Gossypium laxum]|uniref:Uncharacterized protein n=1 Tax=Gossypium laxum TaxID=34288 RepID=A0A7J9AXV2_9ROSI|nr:hypothetical protein [Gossypium laxum]